MAQQDGVGNAGGEGLIRIAQDDVVDFGRSQGMLIADDGIAAGAFIQGVAGTDDFGIADVGAGVMIAVNQVIFAHGFFRSFRVLLTPINWEDWAQSAVLPPPMASTAPPGRSLQNF